MGARVALALAASRPELVTRLVLESPSAGIADAAERARRRAADEALATDLERDGLEAFVDRWEALPMFASHRDLPEAVRARLRAIRLANDAAGIAATLRGAGQGAMAPLHDRLSDIGVPTLIIAGDRDAVGLDRARDMAAAMPDARLEVIAGVGHTPHLEAPEAFDRLVTGFMPPSAII